MPGIVALNAALAEWGLTADVAVINSQAGCRFDRSGLMPGNPPELIRQTIQELTGSLDEVGRVFGLPQMSCGSPLLTTVGFTDDPEAINKDELVCSVRGAGFFPHQNPHWPCLALVCDPDQALNLALLMPFADAPAVWGVYIGKRRDGSPFVVPFAIMAIWQRLPGNRGGLIWRTIKKVRAVVEAQNAMFNYSNLWVFVSPGATQLEFGDNQAEMLSQREQDRFTHTELIAGPRAGQPGESTEVEVRYLNLVGWVSHIFRTLEVIGERHDGAPVYIGVIEDHLFTLNHNTAGSDVYSSSSSEGIRSNALVGVLRRI